MDFRKLFEKLQGDTERMKAKRLADVSSFGENLGLNPEQAKEFADTGEQIGQTTGTIKKVPPGVLSSLENIGAQKLATVEGGVKLKLPKELAEKLGMAEDVIIPNKSLGKGDFGGLTQKVDTPKDLGKVFLNGPDMNVAEQIQNARKAEQFVNSPVSKHQDFANQILEKSNLDQDVTAFAKLKAMLNKK